MKIILISKVEPTKETPISSSPVESENLKNFVPQTLKQKPESLKLEPSSTKKIEQKIIKHSETPPPVIKKIGSSLYDPPVPQKQIGAQKSQSFVLPIKQSLPKDETVVLITDFGDKYVGKVKNGLKNGKGELHFISGNKYYGDWKNDKMEGFGVFICEEYTYHGNWINGEKEGNGIMIYGDGTIFEGNFKKGEKLGEGKLMMANGDSICGLWNGENVQGNFKKGSIYDATKCGTILLKEKLNKLSDHSLTFGSTRASDLIINKWDTLFKYHKKTIKEIAKKCEISVLDIKQTITQNKKDAKESMYFLVDKLCINDLNFLIEIFIDIFNWKYAKSEVKKSDRPQAMDDFLSFIEIFYLNFISIISEELVDFFNKKLLKAYIKNFILKKVYKRLFSIYTYIFKDKDMELKQKILGLQNSSPKDFGIQERLVPQTQIPYSNSISILERISNYQSAIEKFDCLVEASRSLIKELEAMNITSNLGQDDLFPISLFIFVKAKISNVYSLMQFLHDFTDENVTDSERYFRVTVFELTIEFINKIDSNLRDNFGVITPVTIFDNEIESCINQIYRESKRENNTLPYLTWIATLFIEVSNIGMKEMGNYHPKSIINCSKVKNKDYVNRILKIGGLKLLEKENGEYDVLCEKVYPTVVYTKIASSLEKILEEIIL